MNQRNFLRHVTPTEIEHNEYFNQLKNKYSEISEIGGSRKDNSFKGENIYLIISKQDPSQELIGSVKVLEGKIKTEISVMSEEDIRKKEIIRFPTFMTSEGKQKHL